MSVFFKFYRIKLTECHLAYVLGKFGQYHHGCTSPAEVRTSLVPAITTTMQVKYSNLFKNGIKFKII